MRILGISAYYHDSAAALVEDGHIVAAAQEERFTRIKADAAFPHHAVAHCLDGAGVHEDELDAVVFYEDPRVKFERLLTTYHLSAPWSWRSFLRSMPSWLNKKLWMQRGIADELGIERNATLCDHHVSHAASAFFPSPFDEAAILTVDGVGEWSTATYGVGRGNKLELLREIRFPNSVGLLYSAFTYFTGFKVNSGEYKLMGLAPYGKPKYADILTDKILRLHADGSIELDQRYFDYVTGLKMTSRDFERLFGRPPRKPESEITEFEMDLAASVQSVVNDIVVRMGRNIHEQTGMKNLVMAGGVALNCVANGVLLREGPFERIWVQPAAGDAGGAIGAALWYWYQVLGNPRQADPADSMKGAFLGTEIGPDSPADDQMLDRLGARWETLDEDALVRRIAQRIADGKVVAVARGRAEFGPRALGARSILGDARSPDMQTRMNLQIKFRESFRPFAPAVLREDVARYFDTTADSPYMLIVSPVAESQRCEVADPTLSGLDLLKLPRSTIPAVTHVDYSARVQTVDPDRNPFFYRVLSEFKRQTDCSVMINTSFNVRGEPIVNTAEDAFRCFMATEIDCLVVGNRFLEREAQVNRPLDDAQREEWLKRFELD